MEVAGQHVFLPASTIAGEWEVFLRLIYGRCWFCWVCFFVLGCEGRRKGYPQTGQIHYRESIRYLNYRFILQSARALLLQSARETAYKVLVDNCIFSQALSTAVELAKSTAAKRADGCDANPYLVRQGCILLPSKPLELV